MSTPDELVELRISTRNPSAWLAVDLETGDVWRNGGDGPGDWRGATAEQINRLLMCLATPRRDDDYGAAVGQL